MPTETEIKLLIAPERAPAIDAALRRLPLSHRATLDARYFDTRDGRLARHGIALRLRKSGRSWEQTLKAAGRSAVEREEHNVARPGRWAAEEVPRIDPFLHRDTQSGALLQAALDDGDAAGAELLPIYRVSVVRRTAPIEFAGANIEIAFDLGWITAGERSERVCEIEYELKGGDAAALVSLSQEAVRAHGALLSVVSKAERGDRLAQGASGASAHKAASPRLDRAMSGGALLHAALRSCLAQVLANASEVAAGRWDEETVHQWRVGLRRLRTATRELGPLVPGFDAAAWEPRLTAAFRALGAFRDRDTVARSFGPRLAEAGSPDPELISQESAAADDPGAIVGDTSLQCALLDALGAVLATPSVAAAGSAVDPAAHIAARLDKLRRRLKRDAKAFAKMEVAEQHAVRKRVKRLRYLTELVRSLYPAGKVARWLKALEPAQEALGQRIDLLLAIELARDRAQAQGGPAWFNVGWLVAQLPASSRSCIKALARAAKARPCW